MKCENFYCIYEQDGECLLEQIEINSTGMCSECILPSFPPDMLEKVKYIQREKFRRQDEEF